MPKPEEAMLEAYLGALDDIASGTPISANVRLKLASDALFLYGVGRGELNDLANKSHFEALFTQAELETL